MNGKKAKLLRENSFGKGYSKHNVSYREKSNGQRVCIGAKELYKLLKKTYKKNRMNHLS